MHWLITACCLPSTQAPSHSSLLNSYLSIAGSSVGRHFSLTLPDQGRNPRRPPLTLPEVLLESLSVSFRPYCRSCVMLGPPTLFSRKSPCCWRVRKRTSSTSAVACELDAWAVLGRDLMSLTSSSLTHTAQRWVIAAAHVELHESLHLLHIPEDPALLHCRGRWNRQFQPSHNHLCVSN